MSEAKPANAPWISPYLTVRDADKAIEFYTSAFGFNINPNEHLKDKQGRTIHVSMLHETGVIMLSPEGASDSNVLAPVTSDTESPIGLYVYCSDVNAIYRKAKAANAIITKELDDMFWGDRVFSLIDPDGHRWTFATKVSEFDPTNVPQSI